MSDRIPFISERAKYIKNEMLDGVHDKYIMKEFNMTNSEFTAMKQTNKGPALETNVL